MSSRSLVAGVLLVVGAVLSGCDSGNRGGGDGATITFMNVSYDPTREFYGEFNKEFAKHWKETAKQDLNIEQSNAGSGKQARDVINGKRADVVTLALAYDIDMIHKEADLLPADWQKRLPHNSSPYTSTIIFVVRKGNPKGIKDWDDLIKDGVQIVTPNPKVSGAARWAYLAAWGYQLKKPGGDADKAREFVKQLFQHVPKLDSGARAATSTFVENQIGDVMLTWENEAFYSTKEFGADKFEVVVPSMSILAEPPVAVVDKVAEANGTTKIAQAYLEYLYSPVGQKLAAKYFYRPTKPEEADPADMARFPKVELFTIDELFGGWAKAQKEHFADGGTFDQIYVPTGG